MTSATLRFSVPCDVLGKDPSVFLQPDIGPTWPQEPHEVTLHDLKPELKYPEKAKSPIAQLDSRGFAVLKAKSKVLGSLAQQKEWNAAFLAVSYLGLDLSGFISLYRGL